MHGVDPRALFRNGSLERGLGGQHDAVLGAHGARDLRGPEHVRVVARQHHRAGQQARRRAGGRQRVGVGGVAQVGEAQAGRIGGGGQRRWRAAVARGQHAPRARRVRAQRDVVLAVHVGPRPPVAAPHVQAHGCAAAAVRRVAERVGARGGVRRVAGGGQAVQRGEAGPHQREDGALGVRARFRGVEEGGLEVWAEGVVESGGGDDEVLCLVWARDALRWRCRCACRWWKRLEVCGVVSVSPVRR